jgi:hypothetical protein
MTVGNGTTVVLVYVLASIGLIIAFLLAAFVIGCSLIGCASAAAESTEKSSVGFNALRARRRSRALVAAWRRTEFLFSPSISEKDQPS